MFAPFVNVALKETDMHECEKLEKHFFKQIISLLAIVFYDYYRNKLKFGLATYKI